MTFWETNNIIYNIPKKSGLLFSIFSSQAVNEFLSLKLFLIFLIYLSLLVLPGLSLIYFYSLNYKTNSDSSIYLGKIIEKYNCGKFLVPFFYIYLRIFNSTAWWPLVVIIISTIISFFSILLRVIFLLYLGGYYQISNVIYQLGLEFMPFILLNAYFVIVINYSIYISERILTNNINLCIQVYSHVWVRGILKDSEETLEELEKAKQIANRPTPLNIPPQTPKFRRFWSHCRSNIGVIGAVASVSAALFTGFAAYNSYENNRLTERSLDQKDVDKGRMSQDAYNKKWFKK